jgi:Leucine-rich repeat (LRR) protein
MINILSKALINNTDLSWDVTKDPCSWKGVRCSPGNLSITEISLSGFSLSSSDFLPLLCQIDSLVSLDLSNNRLASIPDGFITDCGKIGGLQLLNISRNRLGGPLLTFHGFVGLQFLDSSFNNLSGNISLQLEGLVALKSLNLSANNLSGPVPDRIGDLSKLEVLILSANVFSGKIPETLSSIKSLSRFAANQNNFEGTIPSGLTRFLRNLDLSYNKLSGSIPPDMLAPSSNLQTVDLSYNLLEGPLPPNISQNMIRLRLGSNLLNGTIPSAAFGTLEKLMYLELENNSLTGSVPPELGSCRNLMLLNLAGNKLNGALPGQLGGLSQLQVMKLQSNKLVGEIPVEITQLQKLLTLNISWNSLNGSIPSTISSLQSLTSLHLQNNHLSGPIPLTIVNMDSLLELQLGGNQLIGKIPSMPVKLQIALNLSTNLLEGPIPNSLLQLTALEVLDLSNNSLSGEIPTGLTKMAALTKLLLSNNQLSGIIPKSNPWLTFDAKGNTNLTNASSTTSNTSPKTAKKGKSVTAALVIGFAAALFAVGVVIGVAVSISRRYYRVNDEQSQSAEDLPPPRVLQGNLLTANAIHRSNIDFTKAMEAVADPSNITLKTKFSTYYKAIMPSGSSYFVKRINWSDKIFQLGSHDKFWRELEVLGKLSNSNVMTPLAYVLTVENAYLFYEFAPKGTLFDILHGSSGNALDWASRYSIAVGVAQGLAFLHGCTCGPILLLDPSSTNIMLKSLKEPQVGDIELYKVIDPSKSTGSLSMVAGSVGYIPPGEELFASSYRNTFLIHITANIISSHYIMY